MWFATASNRYKHYFNIIFWICLCIRVCICELGDQCSLLQSSLRMRQTIEIGILWPFLSIYVIIIENVLKCNMQCTSKKLFVHFHFLSFIGHCKTNLTQLSTKGFNGAMRKLFIKYTKLCPKNAIRLNFSVVLWPIKCLIHYYVFVCYYSQNHFRLSSIRLHLNSTHI